MTRRGAQLDGINDSATREKFKRLEQRIRALENRIVTGDVNIFQGGPGGLSNHAKTHATQTAGSDKGTDPLDRYEMHWREKQRIDLSLGDAVEADVPLTVKHRTDATGDMVNVLRKDGGEGLTVTSGGKTACASATENATLNTQPVPVSPLEPDEVSISPWVWVRGDDIQQNDSSNVYSWIDRSGNGNNLTAVENPSSIRFKIADADVNSHNVVEQSLAPECSMAVSGSGGGIPDPSAVVYGDAFTMMIVYRKSASNPTGRHRLWGSKSTQVGNEQGVESPEGSSSSFTRLYFGDVGTRLDADDAADYSGNNAHILIIRRDHATNPVNGVASGVYSFTSGLDANGNAGDKTKSSPATDSRQITFDGLFSLDDGSSGPAGMAIAEAVTWKDFLPDDEVQSLYEAMAIRYGLTQLTATGDTFQAQDKDGNAEVTIDANGFVGCGDSDPDRRLHIEDGDGNPQAKIAYDASNYFELEATSAGAAHLHAVLSGGASARHMVKIPRGTSLPTAADFEGELFILDRSVSSEGDELYVAMQDQADTVQWVSIFALGTSSGGHF